MSQDLKVAILNKDKIPDNKLAKLMYYLECVSKVIESKIEERYTNYDNYNLLSKLEQETVLNLVSKFNKNLMLDLNLFILEPDFIDNDKDNEFLDISDERLKVKINSEVVIEEVPTKVLKVMACNKKWLEKYYDTPLDEFENPKEEKIEEKKIDSSCTCDDYFTCCTFSCSFCCDCDIDRCCESCWCCCGMKCPDTRICGNRICPSDNCSCECLRDCMCGIISLTIFIIVIILIILGAFNLY